MTKLNDLSRLGKLTDMVLQLRLADLRDAARQKEDCAANLAAISTMPPAVAGLEGTASELAQLNYQRWVDNRREELNRQLARKTATWLEALDTAKAAFGKDRSLSLLAKRLSDR